MDRSPHERTPSKRLKKTSELTKIWQKGTVYEEESIYKKSDD
jgi:hypothetical protein